MAWLDFGIALGCLLAVFFASRLVPRGWAEGRGRDGHAAIAPTEERGRVAEQSVAAALGTG